MPGQEMPDARAKWRAASSTLAVTSGGISRSRSGCGTDGPSCESVGVGILCLRPLTKDRGALRECRQRQALSEEPDLRSAVLAHDLEQLQAAGAEAGLGAASHPPDADPPQPLLGAAVVPIRRHQQPAERVMRARGV